jgi:hypothetical protein
MEKGMQDSRHMIRPLWSQDLWMLKSQKILLLEVDEASLDALIQVSTKTPP